MANRLLLQLRRTGDPHIMTAVSTILFTKRVQDLTERDSQIIEEDWRTNGTDAATPALEFDDLGTRDRSTTQGHLTNADVGGRGLH
jgi:hypothetical protein